MIENSKKHGIVQLSGVRVKTKGHAYVTSASDGKTRVNLKLLHRRLAHVNCGTIVEMVKHDVVDGLQEAKQ